MHLFQSSWVLMPHPSKRDFGKIAIMVIEIFEKKNYILLTCLIAPKKFARISSEFKVISQSRFYRILWQTAILVIGFLLNGF